MCCFPTWALSSSAHATAPQSRPSLNDRYRLWGHASLQGVAFFVSQPRMMPSQNGMAERHNDGLFMGEPCCGLRQVQAPHQRGLNRERRPYLMRCFATIMATKITNEPAAVRKYAIAARSENTTVAGLESILRTNAIVRFFVI